MTPPLIQEIRPKFYHTIAAITFMHSLIDQEKLVGPTPVAPLISFTAGLFYTGMLVLVGFMDTYPGIVPVIGVLIPLSIVLAHYDHGIISIWLGLTPFAVFHQWKGACWGGIDCVSTMNPYQAVPLAIVVAVTAGGLGYVINIVAQNNSDPSVAVPLGYYIGTVLLLFGAIVAVDKLEFFPLL